MLPAYLTESQISDLIAVALDEDIGTGDVTTIATIPPATSAEAVFLAKQNGVVAGLHVAEQVLKPSTLTLKYCGGDRMAITSKAARSLAP